MNVGERQRLYITASKNATFGYKRWVVTLRSSKAIEIIHFVGQHLQKSCTCGIQKWYTKWWIFESH